MKETSDDLQMGLAEIFGCSGEFFTWNSGLDTEFQGVGSALAKHPLLPCVTTS